MQLDQVIHNELRLRIMVTLLSVEEASFVYLRNATGATAGNLSSHLSKLKAAHYITIVKGFASQYPNTTIRITDEGRRAITDYIDTITKLLKVK